MTTEYNFQLKHRRELEQQNNYEHLNNELKYKQHI